MFKKSMFLAIALISVTALTGCNLNPLTWFGSGDSKPAATAKK